MPGTFGSLLGVGLHAGLRHLLLLTLGDARTLEAPGISATRFAVLGAELVLVTLIAGLGIWAGTRVEKLSGKKDPGTVVVDEVAGQMLALAATPLTAAAGPTVLAFLVFRVFDIIKPYPARRFESLRSGWGIMADDLVAGVYAALTVGLVLIIW